MTPGTWVERLFGSKLFGMLKLNLYPWSALLQRHATSYEGAWEKVNLLSKLSILLYQGLRTGQQNSKMHCQ